jgi:ligand-binding sensor domain-containing protein
LWIGTAGEGIIGFDGSRFRHVRPKDVRFRDVTSIQGVKTGHVLLGTAKAECSCSMASNFDTFHESLKNIRITALAGDETDLWVGTADRGLLHWRAGQVTSVGPLADPHVLSVAVAEGGNVYAGTALGLWPSAVTMCNGRLAKAFSRVPYSHEANNSTRALSIPAFTRFPTHARGRDLSRPRPLYTRSSKRAGNCSL